MSRAPLPSLAALAAALLTTSAHAGVFVGTPLVVRFMPVDSSSLEAAIGTLDAIELDTCGSGTDVYPVDESVDLVAGFEIEIDSGDFCQLFLYFSTDIYLVGNDGAPYTEYLDAAELKLERIETPEDHFWNGDIGATHATIAAKAYGD